jgi:chromosome segregation ATPase
LAATRADLATERQSRIEAEQRAAVLDAQKIDLEGRLGDMKNESQRVREQLETGRARAEKLADELAEARVKIEVNEARITGQAQQIEIARKDVDQARAAAKAAGDAAMLRGKLDESPLALLSSDTTAEH